MRKSTLLMIMIAQNMDSFVDWEKGKCSFDSREFIDILKLAATAADDAVDYSDEESSQFSNGQALCKDAYVMSLEDIQLNNNLYGDQILYVGYPTVQGGRNVINSANSGIAISSKCADQDIAWEFIRYFILPEAQQKKDNWQFSGFPVLKSAMEDYIEYEMTPSYYTDEQGEQVELMDQWNVDGVDLEIGSVTEEERDILYSMLENCTYGYSYDEQIMSIIKEEAAAYFEGKKSAEDVAAIIQNRVGLYVKENY